MDKALHFYEAVKWAEKNGITGGIGGGLFGFIGYNPRSELLEGMLDMDHGYIKTDDNMHTNIPGVFAAGDIRVKALRQVVTAAADGAIAAMQAEKYVSEHEN